MIIMSDTRKSGKTTNAIKMACATKSVLIVPSGAVEECVRRQARALGYPVNVCVARNYFKDVLHRGGVRRGERVVIDELDSVLRELFGCEIILATTTGVMIQAENLKAGLLDCCSEPVDSEEVNGWNGDVE